MTVAATGAQGKALDNLQTLLAASSTFQTWVDEAGDPTAAKDHIYRVAVGAPIAAKRPFASVGLYKDGSGFRWEAHSGGAVQHGIESGRMWLGFEGNVAEAHEDDEADAEITFLNTVDAVLTEIEALAGSDTYLNVTAIEREWGPRHSDPGEDASEGNYFQVLYAVEYGP